MSQKIENQLNLALDATEAERQRSRSLNVGYDEEVQPSTQFGLASLRMGRKLQKGFVITDEPGCYFIPALIDQWRAQGMHKEFLNYDKIETFKDFGGIRLEDDILIIPGGSRFLGDKRTPITVEEVEEIML